MQPLFAYPPPRGEGYHNDTFPAAPRQVNAKHGYDRRMSIDPAALRQVVVFTQASDADRAFLLENSLERHVEESSYYLFQGDPAEFAYVLTAGQVELLQSNPSGQTPNLRTIYRAAPGGIQWTSNIAPRPWSPCTLPTACTG